MKKNSFSKDNIFELIMNNMQVKKNCLGVLFLGQAGFAIKTSSDKRILIDPYLSNSAERVVGFKRMTPIIFDYSNIKTDFLICTHDHIDHLDIDAVPEIMKYKGTKLFGPTSVYKSCAEGLGINKGNIEIIDVGMSKEIDGIRFKAVYCDHGELSPDAIGILIQVDNISIYYPGDTSYSFKEIKTYIENVKIDIILPAINGAYGNMDAAQAAKFSKEIKARVCIPCHFWTFIEHGGDPLRFSREMEKVENCETKFMALGDSFIFNNNNQ